MGAMVMRHGEAIDLYIGALAREGRRPSTLASYERLLNDFADSMRVAQIEELTLEDYERFLSRWVGKSPSTLGSGVSLVKGFSRFLFDRGLTPTDVAYSLKRPRKLAPEDLDVVTVSTADVQRMLDASRTGRSTCA
jgi:site-specific recombinase XerD